MREKDIISCQITGIRHFGIFVECNGYKGLVHISEISDFYIENINDIFSIGDEVTLFVIAVDEQYQRLKLSYKQNHKINNRIRKNLKVIIGFHSLKNMLPKWIKDHRDDKTNEE